MPPATSLPTAPAVSPCNRHLCPKNRRLASSNGSARLPAGSIHWRSSREMIRSAMQLNTKSYLARKSTRCLRASCRAPLPNNRSMMGCESVSGAYPGQLWRTVRGARRRLYRAGAGLSAPRDRAAKAGRNRTPVDSNVRVDDDFDKRCPILTIPFDSHGDRAEFSRQIEEQEARLNRMTPTEYLARRAPLTGPGRHDILKSRRRASQPHQDR